jgi:hypothetical protein
MATGSKKITLTDRTTATTFKFDSDYDDNDVLALIQSVYGRKPLSVNIDGIQVLLRKLYENAQDGNTVPYIVTFEGQSNIKIDVVKFKDNVIAGGITDPKDNILTKIVLLFPQQMTLAYNPEIAVALYKTVEELPGSHTRDAVNLIHKLTINGPWNASVPGVIVAVEESGEPCLAKVLSSYDTRELLTLQKINHKVFKEEIPIVPGVIRQTSNIPGRNEKDSFNCFVMPHFSTALHLMPKLRERALVLGAQRMLAAVEHLHSLGLVHMDIAPTNIFVDMKGLWYLGDFGACVEVNKEVRQTNRAFIYEDYDREKASFDYDWFMLWTTVLYMLFEFGVTARNTRTGDGYADMAAFRRLFGMVKDHELKNVLLKIREKIKQPVIKALVPV